MPPHEPSNEYILTRATYEVTKRAVILELRKLPPITTKEEAAAVIAGISEFAGVFAWSCGMPEDLAKKAVEEGVDTSGHNGDIDDDDLMDLLPRDITEEDDLDEDED